MKARIGMEARNKRVKKMIELRDEWIKKIESGIDVHVILQQGNEKTGINCWTVSLIPIADCYNCAECCKDCYDVNNVCYQSRVQNDRARNSAIHKLSPKTYWEQVEEEIKRLFVMQLRINVGGDLNYEDFGYIADMAKRCTGTDFLFFTKSYDDLNRFLDKRKFPKNVKVIVSRWCNVECDNRHNLPESHVLYEDGRTTAPEFGATLCRGNCSQCAYFRDGCWNLKQGESVIFQAN